MSTLHKHAVEIHAWADGAVIEFLSGDGYWVGTQSPGWNDAIEYRIKPHRWQAEIDAQKAGKAVQGRKVGQSDWQNRVDWQFETDLIEYRIKPEMLRFRVALFNSGFGHSFIVASSEVSEFTLEATNANFVRWLGDWQEVEA